MQKVIVLYASANKGKTTTLNKLIDLLSLVSDYYEMYRSGEGWAYFEIKRLKIVVCTVGDSKEDVKGNIKYGQDKDCDIFITASRTKGGTTNEVGRFACQQRSNVVWIKKDIRELSNNLFAANIFNLIINEAGCNFSRYVYS